MNWSLFRNIIVDLFLFALIIAGFYLEIQYLDNIATFVFILFGIVGILGGLLFYSKSKDKDFSGTSVLSQTLLHRQYIIWSTLLESVAIAGSGHFVIASLLFIGLMFIASGKQALIEAYEELESEEQLA